MACCNSKGYWDYYVPKCNPPSSQWICYCGSKDVRGSNSGQSVNMSSSGHSANMFSNLSSLSTRRPESHVPSVVTTNTQTISPGDNNIKQNCC